MRTTSEQPIAPVRVLLVDDSPDFLESAACFLADDPQIEIVGRVLSGRNALEQLPQLRPDLVLMDLVMPEMNGLEATRYIKARPGAPRVIIMTLYDDPKYRVAARDAGADGFISKADLNVQLLPLIHGKGIAVNLRLQGPSSGRPGDGA